MTRVKICGVTRVQDVVSAVEAGADAVGFISGFESPRNVSLERAAELIGKVPPFVDSVLVTRAEVLEMHLDRIGQMRPSAIQLYGGVTDPVGLKAKLGVKLILPHLVKRGGDEIGDTEGFDAVLSDTYRKGAFGGTGEVSDWALCRELRDEVAPVPFILSGGLNPENVEKAITAVRPFAVDSSSGVEASPGLKDSSKVRAFVDRARGM
ncbi:MAG: phosphoribosylanthranilate isomerase [Nitrososphaerota archaeon]|nr:phosphoribosylanthranilate isomerase [Nitrososphaerota archaeon]MDG6983805.1 phosphoribosylanthranilate isomerase [Nitrososphaerota archaeon]